MIRILLAVVIGLSALPAWCCANDYEAFLNRHCVRCHGPELDERDLRIDQLSRDFGAGGDTHLWSEIIERINSGEMPPPEEPQPTEDEIASTVGQLNEKIEEGRAARLAARPPVEERVRNFEDRWPSPEIFNGK